MREPNQQTLDDDPYLELIPSILSHKSIPIEIEPRKTLNINPNLSPLQKERLIQLLREHKEAFAWDYTDMKGIHPDLCTHHIYIKEYC
jgi:hypothetical protein